MRNACEDARVFVKMRDRVGFLRILLIRFVMRRVVNGWIGWRVISICLDWIVFFFRGRTEVYEIISEKLPTKVNSMIYTLFERANKYHIICKFKKFSEVESFVYEVWRKVLYDWKYNTDRHLIVVQIFFFICKFDRLKLNSYMCRNIFVIPKQKSLNIKEDINYFVRKNFNEFDKVWIKISS